jgi:primosomal protein N' (replication factor Y)
LTDRQQHFYPPFARLIEITFKHSDKKIAREASEQYAEGIKSTQKQIKILGPGEPMITKIRNEFLMHVLLKIPRNYSSLAQLKSLLLKASTQLLTQKQFRSVKVVFDVDPV